MKVVEMGAERWRRIPLLGVLREELGREAGDYMVRWHLTPWAWWPFRKRLYLHVYDKPDNDPCPHDHPFPFRSIILLGGYTEEVYPYEVQPDGKVKIVGDMKAEPVRIRRRPLRTHYVPATCVHRVAELHGRKTITLVIRGPKEQDWGFFVWSFEKGPVKVPGWQYIGLPEPENSAYE